MQLRHNQGDLDGLCGIYSIINGFHYLLKTQKEWNADEDLFPVAARTFGPEDYPDILWDGLEFEQLLAVAKRVTRHVEKLLDCKAKFKIEQPFKRQNFEQLGDFVAALEDIYDPRIDILILGFEWSKGRGGHWTVFRKADSKAVWIFDSSDEKKILRSDLAMSGNKSRPCPSETLRIRLDSWDGEKT